MGRLERKTFYPDHSHPVAAMSPSPEMHPLARLDALFGGVADRLLADPSGPATAAPSPLLATSRSPHP